MTIQHISILPAPAIPKPSDHQITDLRVITRGAEPYRQKRLVWDLHSNRVPVQEGGLPYSETTGPFSHFLVSVDGRCVGRAYACEFPLRREDFGEVESGNHEEGREEEKGEVIVKGVLFGGREVVARGVRIGVRDVFG